MKLKGINPFEQHVEKIVVGVMAVVFLAVVAMQFLLQPNRVKVGTQVLPPADAYRQVEQEARALAAKLADTPKPEDFPRHEAVDLAAQFERALRAPVAGEQRLAGTWPRSEITVGKVEELEGARIAMPVVPAPAGAVAYAFSNALDPMEVAAIPELAPFLQSKEQPYDQAAVSVEARFDGRALAAAMEADPDGEAGPLKPMPVSWWRGQVEVIGVTLEREELASTGEWTGLTTVPPVPGRPGLLATLEKDVTRQRDTETLVQNARLDAARVRRAPYYRSIAGPEWLPPVDAFARDQKGGARVAVERLLKNRAEAEALRQRLTDQLGGGGGRPPAPRREGGGERGGRRPTPPDQQQPDRARAALERRLEKIDEEIAQINAELAALGYSDDPNAQVQAGQPQGPDLPVLEDPAVRVWAHDITAEPGKTYRYRVRVVLNNPVFGRGPALHQEQRAIAESRVMPSEPSAWTAPVQVEPAEVYFISSASEGGEGLLGGTHASAELFKRYYGFWRKGSVSLEPGDRLRAEMKLPKNLFFVDTQKLAGGQPAPGTPPGLPPPIPPGPGRGVPPEVVPGPGKPGPGAGADAETPVLEPWQIPAPTTIALTLDAVFLDAARIPAGAGDSGPGSGARFQAILRDGAGRLVVKSPEERGSALYARVSESAREGETQGQPKPEPVKPQEQPGRPGRPGQEEEPWQPPPGSGGGGGGGGGG